MNRYHRIRDAKHFTWRGQLVEVTPGLYAHLLDALRRLTEGETETEVALDNQIRKLTLTQVEDLLDHCRDSQLRLARARSTAT
jgi:hypothetical protein